MSASDAATLRLRKPGDSADATSSAPASRPQTSSDVHAELAQGSTYDGVEFLVPKTSDTVQSFLIPRYMNAFTFLAFFTITCNALLSFYFRVPIAVNIVIFFFWRAMYNGGLGYLLNVQSTRHQLTKWYQHYTADPSTPVAKFLVSIAAKAIPDGYTTASFPPAFNAWLVYKGLVNFVLVNDSTSYSMLAFRCLTFPTSSEWSLTVIAQYIVGLALFIFNWWAKVDAHRCIGTYCWYWGDFFYRKNVTLTFDGIFELFPHPMYTVGYSVYYGISLITRSYTVLFVSLIAHMAQLVFLVVVEEPHIKRTYGDGGDAPSRDEKALYDAERGWFPSRDDIAYICSVDPFNAGTWAVVAGSVYAALSALLIESRAYAVAQVLVWRVVHWGVLGYILRMQSTKQAWTRHFDRRGRSRYEAFAHWKQLYSLSSTVNLIAFVACAARYLPPFTAESLLTATFAAKVAVGTVLALLALWTSYSTYASVGEFGWFYGDFFIPQDEYRSQLCYTGIYRFLNNPDAVTGYAGLYALALVTDGWVVLGLAIASQAANAAFIKLVEVPHMQIVYDGRSGDGSTELRPEGPLPRRIRSLLKETVPVPAPVREQNQKVVAELRKARTRAVVEVYGIYKRLGQGRFASSAGSKDGKASNATSSGGKAGKVSLSAPRTLSQGTSLTVKFTAPADHADTDWIGIYAVGTPSAPGLSDGQWLYVPQGASGSVTFTAAMLPRSEGVYEVRYHTRDDYDVVASHPIVVTRDAEMAAEVNALPLSPSFTPSEGPEGEAEEPVPAPLTAAAAAAPAAPAAVPASDAEEVQAEVQVAGASGEVPEEAAAAGAAGVEEEAEVQDAE